ncbi:MAG: hypothetical protein HZB51_16735, partial [Chloroflexi bacterium]|nr:hypothetical protein [Chloroflexota bacterium]
DGQHEPIGDTIRNCCSCLGLLWSSDNQIMPQHGQPCYFLKLVRESVWFHHVPWNYRLKSGRTLWQGLRDRYDKGVAYVEKMQNDWANLQSKIDGERFEHVRQRLAHQLDNAREWREVCLDYFGRFIDKI